MLTLRLLGEFEVVRDGKRVPLPPSRRTRALLAYLALTGRRHRRDRLCALLWDVPDDPKGALRWSLSKLRGVVDEPDRPRILADREAVAFEPAGAEIDVLRLREVVSRGLEGLNLPTLADAAEAVRGEFLEGLDLDGCPEFSAWCLAEREELRALHRRLLAELVRRHDGDPEAALPHARALTALEPESAEAWASVVRLLAAAGRRDEAQRHYELGRRALAGLGAQELGVLDRALREAKAAPAPPSPPVASDPAPPMDAPPPASEAERKQVTILCAGLELSGGAEVDPETLMAAVDPAFAEMAALVRRYGGSPGGGMATGLVAVFGAPMAYEDHALRACRAALALRDALAGRAGAPAPSIALHSGEVVIRPGADGVEAIGPVVALAAKLSRLGSGGSVLVTAETARRAEGFLRVHPLADFPPVGGEPVLALDEVGAVRTRWEARVARGLSPFVGRDAEMGQLRGVLARVGSGSGEVTAVVAEPGIGKSRLVHEFVRAAVPAGWTVLEASAAPEDAEATYRPLSGLLRTWFGIEERDAKPEMERKVRARIEERFPDLGPAMPALLSLLDLPVAEAGWATLSPPQRRFRTLDAIKAMVARACREGPVLLIVEDLHWIDGETQAALDTLVDGLSALGLMLLVTHRPEFRHGWAGRSSFTQIRLHPLAPDMTDRLLDRLLGPDPGLAGLRAALAERAEGTPLFVEESVRALAEAGVLTGTLGAYRLDRPAGALEIPSTVQAVIAARIDRLAPGAKALLQLAAVIGREVPYALLREAAGDLPEEALRADLSALQAAEFLYEARTLPDLDYSFKHALTHEVAYAGLLRERRTAIHVDLVGTIERLAADRIDEQVERLAHHAVQGRLWAKAVHYLYRAAGKAIHRSAHRQAVDLLNQGLAILPELPVGRDRLKIELDYQKALGVTLMAAKGWGAQEVSDAYLKAEALAEALGDDAELFVVLRGRGQFYMTRGEVETARRFGERCLALSRDAHDPAFELETHHLFWSNSFFMGDYALAARHAECGIALYERERDHRLTYVYSGHDPGVCCRSFSSLLMWQKGEAAEAEARGRAALDLAGRVDHPLTLALAWWGVSFLGVFRNDPAEARRAAEREIAICEEYLLALLLSQARTQLGWALAAQGAVTEGLDLMRHGLAAITATGAEMGWPYLAALHAEALGRAGRPAEGLAEIERALAMVESNRNRFQLPEILRLKGELLLRQARADRDGAAACFAEAMAVAKGQESPFLELRAASSRARLLLDRRRRSEAQSLLAPLCERFARLGGEPDLEEARALLAS